jgi:hypothetical protein
MHTGTGGTYLWALNPARSPKSVTVTLRQGPWKTASKVWGEEATVTGHTVSLRVPERDGIVVRLE